MEAGVWLQHKLLTRCLDYSRAAITSRLADSAPTPRRWVYSTAAWGGKGSLEEVEDDSKTRLDLFLSPAPTTARLSGVPLLHLS